MRDYTSFRWLPVAFSESLQPVQFDMDSMVSPRVIDCRYDDNTMFFGRGAAINDNELLRWELKLGRDGQDIDIIDSCGLAIIDDGRFFDEAAFDPNVLLHAYIWHSNGGDYRIGGPRASSFISVPIDIDDGEHVWDPDATVWLTAVRTRCGTGIWLQLDVLDEDHDDEWLHRDRCHHYLEERSSRIRIAPFVSLYTGSRAELGTVVQLANGNELSLDTSGAGQDKRAKFPTSKPHISAVSHSFRLIFGRAIISRNGLEAWMFFPERARAEHSR